MKNYENMLNKSYDECCLFLLKKYGVATDDYFSQLSYERFKNGEIKQPTKRKITRTNEGLYVHHIDENKQIMIANPNAIIKFNIPFAYQKKERLVYCNLIEHGILHILIAKKDVELGMLGADNQAHGIGGYVNFIRPQIVQWLDREVEPVLSWQKNCRNTVMMSRDDSKKIIGHMDNNLISNYPITQEKIEEATDKWFLANS